MSNWCNTTHLILNGDKTKMLNVFNRKKPEPPFDQYLNGIAIQRCEEVKYLELHIHQSKTAT